VVRRLIQQKVITPADLPEEVAAALAVRSTAPSDLPPPPAPDQTAAGYDQAFLPAAIALPGRGPNRRALPYIHFSVVLDTERRLAAVAASNLDRSKRVVLPRAAAGFAPDPNVPAQEQADPKWFASPNIDFGHLATRQEISWGAPFTGDDPELARKLDGAVNVLTNAAPQFDTFNRYLWAGVERWILAEHNREAARVTIFTGPVFAADDPLIGGARVPRRFFKIAVSPKAPGSTALVVDAFLASQFQDGTDEKIARTDFSPDAYRVSVGEIERLTGLDFGAAVREAGTSDAAASSTAVAKPKPNVTVYFQFAGMSREDAVNLSNRLKALGWQIPGEERTGAAAKQNEVRYGAETDRAAAEMLVADLQALGASKTMTAKRNASIKPGIIEIWVSR
jgi:DNA/RNA endonuclease G (NUC1)